MSRMIYESPDGGKTVYERKPNEDIKDRRLVTESNDDWKVIRKDYEAGIIAINSLIETHEQKWVKSGSTDVFHKESMDTLIDYMHELKAYIKAKEEDYFK
tara:strand:- start:492 stop:791 length:300 start_codon:yes stop_codon:yes gene_type:complete